jgi:hypothetical protein
MLADKPTADLGDIIGDSISRDDEDDLLAIQLDGTEKFRFDEEQFDATGVLSDFSRQPHRVPRDMLLVHAHPDDFIIALEESCVAVLTLLWVVWIQRTGKPAQASPANTTGVKFDMGGFDFEAYDTARAANAAVPQKVEHDNTGDGA